MVEVLLYRSNILYYFINPNLPKKLSKTRDWGKSFKFVIWEYQKKRYFCIRNFAAVAQLVEHWLPKPRVAGSSPVCRSHFNLVFPSLPSIYDSRNPLRNPCRILAYRH